MAQPRLRRSALWVARRPGVSRIVERMGRRWPPCAGPPVEGGPTSTSA